MGTQHNVRLAVLIDADNAQSSIIRELLVEISKYGVATVKRVYGDWTTPNLRGWKETLNQHALQPIQQFSYTSGKNATDCALIIDAMDLLHSGRVDGFCLVSSDSDFTRLATRIRESGLVVYGFGEQKTPPPFVVACDRFVYTEILRAPTFPAPAAPLEKAGSMQLESILEDAVTAAMRDDGWAPLSGVGAFITKTNPDFDSRNYGYAKLSGLIRAQSFLELKTSSSSEATGAATLYVRLRDKKPSSTSASPPGK